MKLEDLAKNPELISIDSRVIKRGGIFIAIKGARFDGHDFVKEVFKKGASYAVVSKEMALAASDRKRIIKVKDTVWALGEIAKFHRQRFNIPVVAVTGSNGKTTVKNMVAFVLSAGYNVLKNEASRNNLIGLPLTLLGLRKKHRVAVLEMGMNRLGEIDRLSGIALPRIGVITNIGPSHLEFLGTLTNVLKAKSELLKRLSGSATAILNADDAYLGKIRGLKCRTVYFGIEKKCEFQAKDLQYKNNKWYFSLGKGKNFEIPILGRHNVYNALIAIAVGRQFGLSFSTIAKRIRQYRQPSSMRLEAESVLGVKILNDTYNSNPISMECAIAALARYETRGKRIVLCGDMMELGEHAQAWHEAVGRLIAKHPIDALVTLGKFSKFTSDAAKKMGIEILCHAESGREAEKFLKKITKPGDVVLVKGSRAMKMEKVIERLRKKQPKKGT
ncbi:MAG: UDP-N-acetylmuramoyl-tripeptide--D-alanyl-D-alanine ligase [Omnitrophica bacterium]|nr:UDP-N-acetylmuramoyl-tripeptide--D-alanyl-D-alanine ligase [Candidatus Omnitrophota bacterium]